MLVAINDADRVIGMACVLPEGDTADLDALFVDPPAIGSGAGRALFDAAVGACPSRSARGGSRSSPIPTPRRFYERLGARYVRHAPCPDAHSRPHPAVL